MLTQQTLQAIKTDAEDYAVEVRDDVGADTEVEVAGVVAFAAYKAALGRDLDDDLEDKFIELAKSIS